MGPSLVGTFCAVGSIACTVCVVKCLVGVCKMACMDKKLPFDTTKEETELAAIREREEEDVARILSEKYGMAYTDLALKAINTDALRVVPEEKARAAEAVAFDEAGEDPSLGLHPPHN